MDIKLTGQGRGVTRALGVSRPVTMQYVYTVEHRFFNVTNLRSRTLNLRLVCIRKDDLHPMEEIQVRIGYLQSEAVA